MKMEKVEDFLWTKKVFFLRKDCSVFSQLFVP